MSVLEIQLSGEKDSGEPRTPILDRRRGALADMGSPIPLFISPKKNARVSFASLPSAVEDIVLAALLHIDPGCFFRSIPLVCRGWLRAYQSPMLYCGGLDMRWLAAEEETAALPPATASPRRHRARRLSNGSSGSTIKVHHHHPHHHHHRGSGHRHRRASPSAENGPPNTAGPVHAPLRQDSRSATENLLHLLKRRNRLQWLTKVVFPPPEQSGRAPQQRDTQQRAVTAGLRLLGQHCPHLTHVNLNGAPATDDGLRVLAEGCPQLQYLNLESSRPGVTNFGVFAVASHCKRLSVMRASRMVGINASGVRWLLEGVGPSLRQLWLAHCPYVGGAVAQTIAQRAPNLRVLRMEGIILTQQQFHQFVGGDDRTTTSNSGGRVVSPPSSVSPLLRAGGLECLALDGHDAVDWQDVACVIQHSPRLRHLALGKGIALTSECLALLAGGSNFDGSRSHGDDALATADGVACPLLTRLEFRPVPDTNPSVLHEQLKQLARTCAMQLIKVRHQGGGTRSISFFPQNNTLPPALCCHDEEQ